MSFSIFMECDNWKSWIEKCHGKYEYVAMLKQNDTYCGLIDCSDNRKELDNKYASKKDVVVVETRLLESQLLDS